MIRHDIKVEADYINANNDLEWYESDIQHMKDTINATKGSYKENPQDGVGIMNYANSSTDSATIAREVIIELKKDLYQCNNPTVTYSQDGTVTVYPNVTI